MEELEAALCGANSSLKIYPSYASLDGSIHREKPILAIDMGGTNYRIAKVWFDRDGYFQTDGIQVYPMPGTLKAITKNEFIKKNCEYITANIDDVDRIAISLGYNIVSMPDKDAIIEKLSKEVQITSIENIKLAYEIKQELLRQGVEKEVDVFIINDIVATVLAGKVHDVKSRYNGYIGLIVGTGMNTSYVEAAEYVHLTKEFGGGMIIHTESGDYSKQKRSSIDIDFDRTTSTPNDHGW